MKLIYFDNGATSHFKPFCVVWAFLKNLKISANSGRSGHKLSLKNAFEISKCRDIVCKHFGTEQVVFTKNCTEALNIAILGLAKKLGGHIVCSCFEHNSVLRPLHEMERAGIITLSIVTPTNSTYITVQDIKKVVSNKTTLVCVNAISNVTGTQNDIENIGKFCKEKGILFLVDDAQGVGHIKINMENIDYLAFSGHKGFLTPQGIGALCINSKTLPLPTMFGGTGTESDNLLQPLFPPESYESGTLPTSLICSLSAGIKYTEKHFLSHNKKTLELTKYLIENLKKLNFITLYSTPNPSGVVAFNVKQIDSNKTSDFLDKCYNIATRSGLHCAPLTHKFFGTLSQGMVRVSLNFRNNKREIDKLIVALKDFNNKMSTINF